MKIKQSVCLPMMKPAEAPMPDFLKALARIDYPAVEIWQRDDDFETFVDLCRENDLVLAGMVGHAALGNGLNDPAQHDRIEAELRESIDLAARFQIPGLICFSGNRREGLSDEEGIGHTVAGLRRIAPHAEEKGVNLNLELLNSKVNHPGYQCDHTSWGVAVCEQVDSLRVKLLYDIYHMQIMEGDIIRTIQENIEWIGHFHTAGVPGRRDFDETQELNYAAVCRAIAAADYDLYVGHEFRPKEDALEALEKAFAICDQE